MGVLLKAAGFARTQCEDWLVAPFSTQRKTQVRWDTYTEAVAALLMGPLKDDVSPVVSDSGSA